MKYLIVAATLLSLSCSTPSRAPVVYSPSQMGLPGLLMTPSTGNEAEDFRSLYALAEGACRDSYVKVSSWGGSCSEEHCYQTLGFQCKEKVQ